MKHFLPQNLKKYMVAFQNHHQLLLQLLSKMQLENMTLAYYKTNTVPASVALAQEDFELRAQENDIHRVGASFYQSAAFTSAYVLCGKQIISK